MAQGTIRDRLVSLIKLEGVNQKHIARQTHINEGLLSRFKNNKTELGMLDVEALDKFLLSKGY